MTGSSAGHLWWRRAVIYQVYTRSFMDSDGDGVGDLAGITSRLDYLADLGIDAVWLSPIYPSPMADFGYDVSNYTAVHPMFGDLQDFDAMVERAHGLGLKVVLDYVPNHTSDEHEWFVESRSSRENPKRDWYVWRDAAPGGGVPNNWQSEFGGTAWTWDEATRQYYYHAYHARQPDLNWRNPEVVGAMMDVLRFWVERGVDGFRVDAVNHLVEDEDFRDDPPNPDWREGDHPATARLLIHTTNLPETHEAIARIRRTVEEYDDADRLMIGEVYLPVEELMAYYGVDGAGFHLPTNMHLVRLDRKTWDAASVSAYIDSYEAALPDGAWPNWVVGNHDNPRVASRLGGAQARVAAMLLLTLRGSPTIYYGDELAMTNGDIPPALEQDPVAKSAPGHGRDPERTPMQWDATRRAGFTTGDPWLPVSEDRDTKNAQTQKEDPRSTLNLHRGLLSLRRREDALSVGSYRTLSSRDNVLVYEREHDGGRFVVALNFGGEGATLDLGTAGRVVLSTRLDRGEEVSGVVSLRGDEGVVIRVS